MKRIQHIIIISLYCGFICLFSQNVQAFDDRNYTNEEKVAFSFHKLSNTEPDLKTWIQQSDTYKNASTPLKQQIMLDEEPRLQKGWQGYNKDTDLIRAFLRVDIILPSDEEIRTLMARKQKIPVHLVPGVTYERYFMFRAGDKRVAIIPEDLEKFLSLTFTYEEFESFYESLLLSDDKEMLQGDIELMLRPVSVDTEMPMMLENKEAWLMIADIGSFRLYKANHRQPLWSYNAPWYVPKGQKKLLDLYQPQNP